MQLLPFPVFSHPLTSVDVHGHPKKYKCNIQYLIIGLQACLKANNALFNFGKVLTETSIICKCWWRTQKAFGGLTRSISPT